MPITGRNAKRVLFGAINLHTGHRVVLMGKWAGVAEARDFFENLLRYQRRACLALAGLRLGAHYKSDSALGRQASHQTGVAPPAVA